MNTSNSLKKRPDSARYIFSPRKRNTSMKSQVNEESKLLYTQRSNTKGILSTTRFNAPELKRLLPKRTDLSPERLFQQNMALKKKINQLNQYLKLQKTKRGAQQKANSKWKRKLDIEFEKQMYWGQKGQYMVMGVKNQYDKIKKMYDEKCKQNYEIKKNLEYTNIQEVKTQLEVYKQQVARLKNQIDKFIQIYQIPYNQKTQTESSYRLLVAQMVQNTTKLQHEISTYKSGIQNMDKLIKERDEKIQFLQKLIVSKDNESYQLEQLSRRVQHQNDNLRVKNKQFKLDLESEKQSVNQRILDVKVAEQRRLERQSEMYENQIHQKTQKITKLEAQIVYLSTLLAQWRPSDSNEMRNHLFDNSIDMKNSISLQRKESNAVLSIYEGDDFKSRDPNEVSKQMIQPVMYQSNVSKNERNSTHYTLKRDKVRKDQIEGICYEIKFRLLNKKINILQAKTFVKPSQGENITIKDLIEIFSQQPFCVESTERRILLARYLVEDIDDNTIFYDQNRSQTAIIVRSIFEQVIPRFTIPSADEESNIRQKVVQMLSQFHVTLTQVVTQHNRQMIINQKKFIEILDEQQVNMGPQYNDYMMQHMLKSSSDITQMNFKSLLTLVKPKNEN